MVQLLPAAQEKSPSFLQSIVGGFAEGVPGAIEKYQNKKSISSLLGPEAANLPPEFQKIAYEAKLKQEGEANKLAGTKIEDLKSYDTIKKRFGEEAANLWQSATEGGKTKIVGHLLENEQRGMKLNNQLGEESPSMMEQGQEKPEKTIDYDLGTTPAERTRRQDKRYEKALPLITQSQDKLHAYDSMGSEIETLKQLSPQISGWERLNINPMTGELLIPGLASTEAQQFVKTVNDFTIQAKDSYGARVTNFDLNQFMKRLPTLANSAEGRARILEQMRIINDLNKMYESSLHDVFEQHGGIRNIDYDKASAIAYKKFLKESQPLKSELKQLSSAQNNDYKHIVEQKRKLSPPGHTLMVDKEGNFGYVAGDISEAIKDGLIEP